MRWLFRGKIHIGTLTISDPTGRVETFRGSEAGPVVTIHLSDPNIGWKILLNPELRFAEAYMDGTIEVVEGDLRDLLMLLRLNRSHIDSGSVIALFNRLFRALRRFHQNNTLLNARHNAAHHYGLGNGLYRLFLDQDMQYSCAYFETGDETLEQAQLAKKRHIAAKLRLEPGQRVLDIGCGWGGMALYLARMADVEVLGVTLAEEQLKLARQRAEAAGLAHKVRFELQDYRKVRGQFDRIVSVGMMEHVGAGQLDTYFRTVGNLLAPDGVALIHSIMTTRSRSHTDPFTQKYIFPGGYVPGASEAAASVERSRLWLLDFEVWRKHYGITLGHWYDRFMANRDQARALYDERFCRMWELYLLGFESSFLTGNLAVMQLQIGHTRDAAPLTRGYISDATARLKAREALPDRGAKPA